MTTPTQAIGAEPSYQRSPFSAQQMVDMLPAETPIVGENEAVQLTYPQLHQFAVNVLEARATQPTMVYSPEKRKPVMLNDEAVAAGVKKLNAIRMQQVLLGDEELVKALYHAVHAEIPNYAPAPAAQTQEAVAWARKWFIDGETPAKERKENGRMAWTGKFKFLPVTQHQCFPDDVALGVLPPPPASAPSHTKAANPPTEPDPTLQTR